MDKKGKHRGKKNADEAFLAALACGSTIENAAAKAGFSSRTAHRRLEDPEFQKRLASFKIEMIKRSADVLTAATLEAIKTLLELQKPNVRDAVRLSAARSIIELGVKMREIVDWEQRIAAMEKRLHLEGK